MYLPIAPIISDPSFKLLLDNRFINFDRNFKRKDLEFWINCVARDADKQEGKLAGDLLKNLSENLKNLELFEGVLRNVEEADAHAEALILLIGEILTLTSCLDEEVANAKKIEIFFKKYLVVEDMLENMLPKKEKKAAFFMTTEDWKILLSSIFSVCAYAYYPIYALINVALTFIYFVYQKIRDYRVKRSNDYTTLLSDFKADLANLKKTVEEEVKNKEVKNKEEIAKNRRKAERMAKFNASYIKRGKAMGSLAATRRRQASLIYGN